MDRNTFLKQESIGIQDTRFARRISTLLLNRERSGARARKSKLKGVRFQDGDESGSQNGSQRSRDQYSNEEFSDHEVFQSEMMAQKEQ